MKVKTILTILLVLAACTEVELENVLEEESVEEETGEDSAFVGGVSYVCFSDDMVELVEADLASGSLATKSMGLNEMVDELGIVSIERLFPDAGEYEGRTRRAGLHKWYKITYDESFSVTKATSDLALLDEIEIAQPVWRAVPMTFNDTYFSYQWHYGTTEEYGINLQKAWDEYTVGSSDVIVAVVDGGVQSNHPDLNGVVLSSSEGSKSFVTGYSLSSPMDHGTHVGGTIGAINNNKRGLCGIAGGDYANSIDGVRLLSCMIFAEDKSGNTVSGDSESAIKWAADNGAVICQNSWGYSPDTDGDGTVSEAEEISFKKYSMDNFPALKAAIDYFIEYAGCDDDGNQLEDSPMKGGLVTFAAGNDAISWGLPAAYDAVVAVGASSTDGTQAEYSCYGDWVDIAAPGDDVCSTIVNNYAWMSGTSMACPHVSGVAALVLAYRGCQGYTADMLKEALIQGANYDVLASDAQIGPLLDAYGALSYESLGDAVPPDISSYTAVASGNSISFSWEVEGDSDGLMPTGYIVFAATASSTLEEMDLDDIPSSVSYASMKRGNNILGDTLSLTIADLDFSTDYFVAMVAYNSNGNYSNLSSIRSVSTPENTPPVFDFIEGEDFTVHAHETLEVPFTCDDPDGYDGVTVVLSDDTGGIATLSAEEDGGYILSLFGPGVSAGSYSALLTAEDIHGGVSTYSVSYEVLANHAPVSLAQLEDAFFTAKWDSKSYDLEDYIYDEDGESLSYVVDCTDGDVVTAGVTSSTLVLTAKSYGTATVTLTASDYFGESVTQELKVVMRSASTVVEAYPNPVKTTLYVRTGEEELSTEVTIVSEMGKKVYSATAVTSVFNPMEVDVSGFSAGRYILTVEYDGGSYQFTIVKI